MSAGGGQLTSPYVWSTEDYVGLSLIASFAFDNTTGALGNLTVHRDPGCMYIAVLIGDPNGNVIRVPTTGSIPNGDTTITAAQIAAAGQSKGVTLNTISDVLGFQMTATE